MLIELTIISLIYCKVRSAAGSGKHMNVHLNLLDFIRITSARHTHAKIPEEFTFSTVYSWCQNMFKNIYILK